jgi:hypothetical protein
MLGVGAMNDATKTTGVLEPNKAGIFTHLEMLFNPGPPPRGVAPVKPSPDAWFEIVWNDFTSTEHFSPTQLNEAAEFVVKLGKIKVSVSPGLRHGEALGKNGSGTKENFLMSHYAWTEYDQEGDDKRIHELLIKNLRPSLVVTTGLIPWPRRHLYFRLEQPITDFAEMEAVNKAISDYLQSNRVFDARRVMRLAGTLNFPKAEKPGRMLELTTLSRPPAPAYSSAYLQALTGGTDEFDDYKPRTMDEIMDLLKISQVKEWNNNMRDATASLVGRGWSNEQILGTCAPFCHDGYNSPTVISMIERARKKYNKPEGAPRSGNKTKAKVTGSVVIRISDIKIRQREWL